MNLQTIRHNFLKLSLNIDLDCFLANALKTESLSVYDYQYLQSVPKLRRNQEFLLNLDMYGEDCESGFIKYIKDASIDISENVCSKKSTTDSGAYNRDSYKKVCSLLLSKINANLIAIRLYESEELDSAQLEQVLTKTTRQDRSSTICHFIERKASRPGFMQSFMTSLRDEQPDLHKQVMVKLLVG